MHIVSTEELINYKILPFNIYSEFGEKLFSAGEVLTPGKLLQLRHMNTLYRDEKTEPQSSTETAKENVQGEQKPAPKSDVVIESFDMNPIKMSKKDLSIDEIDILNYKGPINKRSKIEPETQIKIKAFYNKIITTQENESLESTISMYKHIRDKIVQDIVYSHEDVMYSSQLKLLGEYRKCHALNVAILSGVIAKKLELNEGVIIDVVLSALLHDIGKIMISEEILNKTNLSNSEQHQLQSHTKIGYRMLKDMDMPENICRAALEHHEHNDGSGYPFGQSGDRIGIEAQIISVCNFYDNLTFNRTPHVIKNSKEALRIMLELGTKRFSAEALYTFVHMFSYNDVVNFEDMIL